MDTALNSIYSMNILIIDDSTANITLLEAILRKENFINIYHASSVAHALDTLESVNIDLVLLSFILPEFSGIQVCKLIAEDMRYEDIPVIMITANTDMETLKSSFQNGASDYISKPINSVELQARVYSHLIRKQVNDERKNSAITDALTNIYNRRYFDLVFDRQYTKALIEEKALSFFMIDIDNFKKYNDNYGHQMGDEALKAVAKCIKKQLNRENDYIFRVGGEEFAILLFNAPEIYISTLSEQIHAEIHRLNIPHDYNESYGRITISMGITTAHELKSKSKFDIYNQADEALYQAKGSGRSRSVIVSM
jgi:diguanylate cyclase (GGDEF)-like protein